MEAWTGQFTLARISQQRLICGLFVYRRFCREVIYNFNGVSDLVVAGVRGIPDAPTILGFAIYSVIVIASNLKDILRRVNSNGMAILLVEEKVPFALSLPDRLYFMSKGKVVYSDTRHNLEGKQDVFVKHLGVEV